MEVIKEIKASVAQLKQGIERDLMIRRYQKWQQGQVPIEDALLDFLVKIRTYIVTSWRSVVKRSLDMIQPIEVQITCADLSMT